MEKNNKRSERRHTNYLKAKKQLNLLKIYDSVPKNLILGKYKKQHSLNCGRAGCFMCVNPRKMFGYITIKEEMANFNYKESLKEIY